MTELQQKQLALAIARLAQDHKTPCAEGPLPSIDAVKRIITLVKAILFPGLLESHRYDPAMSSYFLGVNIEELYSTLSEQVERSLNTSKERSGKNASEIAVKLIDSLADIRATLMTDIMAMYENDPAATSPAEVIFCYPGANAMIHYRIAHHLLKAGVPLLPRMITELAHSLTGIDIHPGATIGDSFSIDHGTGIVIGETCRIGHHVKVYQGVTLGAKNFKLDADGPPVNLPRHPIIEDNVTIYSNSTILGRITIGHDSTIGGNLWVTTDVAPHSKLVQSPCGRHN